MTLLQPLLIPLSWLYRGGVACRNRLFESGILRTTDVGVPVISVGNITIGGTGKSPLVEYVVQYCLGKGKRVAIISRGYRRESKGVVTVSDGRKMLVGARQAGDEPAQLAMKFPQATVVVGERRVEAARIAVQSFYPDVMILDDGFQHRYLRRNLDIVVVNAVRDEFPGAVLPAGRNREPWSSVSRAGLVVLSHADDQNAEKRWKERLNAWYSKPWLTYRYKTVGAVRLQDTKAVPFEMLKNKPVFAFSGIGHHQDFLDGLKSAGCRIAGDMRFPDHHSYDKSDVESLVAGMDKASAELGITTEKDAARLKVDPVLLVRLTENHQLFYSKIEVEILQGAEVLHELLDKCFTGMAG